MSDVFFEELDIPVPDFNLAIGSGAHGLQTGRMLSEIERVMFNVRPDLALIYGDTNSTLAGALAASKLHIPVAHVEAGLRSFNRQMPEEVNRVVADHLSSILFAPTEAAVRNLAREGICGDRVSQVGDVMYDAALRAAPRARKCSKIHERLGVSRGHYVLATVHRAENTDSVERLGAILTALAEIAKRVSVVLPLHPRTHRKVIEAGIQEIVRSINTIEPVGYLDMLALEMDAKVIVTDSGGVQKEAYFQHVPCVTVREETEWVELVEAGWNRLAPPSTSDNIVFAVDRAMAEKPAIYHQLYGDGQTAVRIVDKLGDFQLFRHSAPSLEQ
jgi:UDP-GlcNAc3NAcA epimerase